MTEVADVHPNEENKARVIITPPLPNKLETSEMLFVLPRVAAQLNNSSRAPVHLLWSVSSFFY